MLQFYISNKFILAEGGNEQNLNLLNQSNNIFIWGEKISGMSHVFEKWNN